MEREIQEGVKLGELWRAIKKRLWLVICSSVLVVVATLLVFRFVINPVNASYQLEFILTYPDSETMKYPDGTPFYFQDIISLSALERAKASDESFAGINITKMVEEDDITVVENEGKYTLTVEQSYFKKHTLATDFLRAVADVPVTIAKEKAGEINYLLEESVFEGAEFEDRIRLLVEQKKSVLAVYDEWIERYHGTYSVSGRTLMSHRAEVAIVLSDAVQLELLSELEKNGYVTLDRLEGKREQLEEELALNKQKIEEIKKTMGELSLANTTARLAVMNLSPQTNGASTAQTSGLSIPSTTDSTKALENFEQVLASLIVRNVEIENQLKNLEQENIEKFEARIGSEYSKLRTGAETLRIVATELYAQEACASFETTRATTSGGTSLAIVGVGVFILMFIIIGAIVCAVELPKEKKAAQRVKEQE